MGQLSIVIDDELDAKFRETIYQRFGLKKGVIKTAVEEAIQLWIDQKA